MNSCSALQQLVNQRQRQAAAQFWSPARTVSTVQSVGTGKAGSPVSAMSSMHFAGVPNWARVTGAPGLGEAPGLGLINAAFCDSFETAVATLAEAVKRGAAAGLSSPNFIQAQQVAADETSLMFYKRSAVGVWNCKDQTDRINQLIANVNAELAQKGIQQVSTPNSVAGASAPPEELSPTAKFAIIGGITVAGIIGVAVITGQIAPLFRAVKRVL